MAIYTVNSPADTPDGDITDHFADTGSANPMNPNFPLTTITTLRAAIQTANAEGVPAEIDFAIPGGGVHTIFTAGLPGITVPITINGNTQDPLAKKPVIELVGGAPGVEFGLGLLAGSDGSTIKGLDIHGFAAADILVKSGGNHITGNFLGLDPSGTMAPGNGNGVTVSGAGNFIGGTTAAERNVISGSAMGSGVSLVFGATGNKVYGNYIGTDATGTTALDPMGGKLGNAFGVRIMAPGNFVGNGAADGRNIISGNTIDGVIISGAGSSMNLVQSNYIGTSVDGTTVLDANGKPLGNTVDGVQIGGGADGNTIGGTSAQGNLISGNGNGVDIVAAGMMGNTVRGNYIGTDKGGMLIVDANGKPLGNTGDGVKIDASPNNKIGATLGAAPDNVISGNLTDGVDITGAAATGNLVQGNYIGTDKAGTTGRGNVGEGVKIETDADNNTIGGEATQRNVISGNVDGIVIIKAGMQGNTVRGNYIGTDRDGKTSTGADGKPLGNTIDGVDVSDSSNNKIGATLGADPDNVISGNGKTGVQISGNLAAQIQALNNKLQGNYIGTDVGGTLALGNGIDGVLLEDATVGTLVGGNAAQRNVISANGGDGVRITDAGTTMNLIQGNYIGTDLEGDTSVDAFGKALGNHLRGIHVAMGATVNTVGGGAGLGNVISGNVKGGVLIEDAGTNGNFVQGNTIGTDAAGSTTVANVDDGVDIKKGAANNTLGGGAGLGNVISGNEGDGVLITGAGTNGNLVQGNKIGSDAAGATAVGKDGKPLGNSAVGVAIMAGAANTTVGGGAGLGNVISGNGGDGVLIIGAATTPNLVQRNFIGTVAGGADDVDANGKPLGNAGDGVEINASPGNTVGGALGAGNVISGNTGNGIQVTGAAAGANIITFNLIGTDVAGNVALGNTLNGVLINGAPGNTIGTAPGFAGGGNLISANQMNGVLIQGAAAAGNTLDGNLIGTDITGKNPLGNTLDGVRIDAPTNTVGAAAPGATDNTIDFNGRAGVAVISGVSNKISGNSIFGNAKLGIDLNGDGVTYNTPSSPHAGPNLLISYPLIDSVNQSTPGNIVISGRLDSTPNTFYTIEFFASKSADPSGFGEGQTYLGAFGVATDANGHATDGQGHIGFSANIAGNVPNGYVVTATARDNNNDTSEFSQAVPFVSGTLSGTVFLDYNASGVQDPNEPGLQGRVVYLDLKHDGTLDAGDPAVTSDANGNYSFSSIQPGTYEVRENVLKDHGTVITAPPGGFYKVTVPGDSTTQLNFGNVLISQVSPVEVVADRFGPASDADAAFVQGVYRNLLARDPDPVGTAFWDHELTTGLARTAFEQFVWESAEHRGLQVDHYFRTFLHREADPGGRDYFLGRFAAGANEKEIVTGFIDSREYQERFGTNAAFVRELYSDVLSHDPDPAGEAFWEGLLAHGVPREAVAQGFVNSGDSDRRIVDGYYSAFLHRPAEPGGSDYWTAQLEQHRQSPESMALLLLASNEYFDGAKAAVH